MCICASPYCHRHKNLNGDFKVLSLNGISFYWPLPSQYMLNLQQNTMRNFFAICPYKNRNSATLMRFVSFWMYFFMAYLFGRVLGFNRVAPVIGYKLNIEEDLFPVANDKLREKFYRSPIGNICIHGKCDYCSEMFPVCTRNGTMEGAALLFIPEELKMIETRNPWMRRDW